MSKQRKRHRELTLERKFHRYFCRAMEHEAWLLRNIREASLCLNKKR